MPARFPGYEPRGTIPAVLLPFHDDLSIDEASYRAHLRDVGGVAGVTAITTNAHASEVAPVTRRSRAGPRGHARRDRRPHPRGERYLCRWHPAGGAAGEAGGGRRCLRAAHLPARRAGARQCGAAGLPGRPCPRHRRRHRPAADRFPVSGGDRPDLSARHAGEAGRGGAELPRHQGLVQRPGAGGEAYRGAARPAPPGERAVDPQRLALRLAGHRRRWFALRLGQRDRRVAGAAVRCGAGR